MHIIPQIRNLDEKKLVGKRITTSMADNKTGELWRSFMPARKDIQNTVGTERYSMQLFDPSYFSSFDANKTFEKWAAVEVSNFDRVPDGMETFTLPGGLYAVFLYKGLSTDTDVFQYIFGTWLPASGYTLDNRPHFEILGAKYKNNDPGSEEEIWIPVGVKQ